MRESLIKRLLAVCALAMAFAILTPAAFADSITYSGTELAGLLYIGTPGTDAQYVSGTPDEAQLYTADSGTAATADSPVVYVQGALGTLSGFSASYDLVSSTGPNGTSPYFILWLTDDAGFTLPIVADGGTTLNASSLVHVGDLTSGSITLGALDSLTDPNSGLDYGLSTIAYRLDYRGDCRARTVLPASPRRRTLRPGGTSFLEGPKSILTCPPHCIDLNSSPLPTRGGHTTLCSPLVLVFRRCRGLSSLGGG